MLVQIKSFTRIESAGCSTLGDEEKAFVLARDFNNAGQKITLANETKKLSQGISVAIDVLNKYEVTIKRRKPPTIFST